MQILIVEDEYRLAQNIAKGLRLENFTVDIANDGEKALEKLTHSYDAVILDLMIPKISGWEVLKKIREINHQMPVLILSAQAQMEDRVKGLNIGADDYVVKPFSFEELLARVHALIRRSTHGAPALKIDNLELNPQAKSVTRAGHPLALSGTEYRLLEYLMRYENHVLNETRLLEQVWDHEYQGLSNIVSVYIRYLRNKIDRDFPEEKPLIHTVRGMGYKISASKKTS